VLVTGGSGFIGTNLVQSLLDDGIAVLSIDIAPLRNPAHAPVSRQVDLMNPVALKAVFDEFQPTCVYHMGARTDLLGKTLADYDANTEGVKHMIDVCKQTPSVQRVIFASSRLVCEIGYRPKSDHDYCPTTPYGESKVEGEKLVRELAGDTFSWTLARPTSIWGPWFAIPYRTFFDHVRAGRYFHPGQLKVSKSFGFVGNSVFQLRKIMTADAAKVHRKTYYIGDYTPIDVHGFASEIARCFKAGPVRSLPMPLLTLASKAGDLLQTLGYKEPPLTTFRLNNLCTNMLHDFWGLDEITGPLPYSMSQGVAKTVRWMEQPQRGQA